MATAAKFPLEVVIKAVDQATGVLSRVQKKIEETTSPVRRLGNSLKALSDSAGVPRVAKALGGVASAAQTTVTNIAAVGAAAGAAAYGVFRLVKSVADAGDRMDELATKTGVNVVSLQRLAYAASFSGIETEQLADAVTKLNKNQAAAVGGNATMVQWFQRAGISVQELRTLKPEQVLERVSDAIAALPAESPKRAALALALLGKSGANMIPFLAEGGKRIREMGDEAERLGLVMDEAATKQAAEFNDQFDRVMGAVRGVAVTIGSALMPVLIPLLQQLREWIVANKGLVATRAQEWAKALGESLPQIINGVAQLIAGVGALLGLVNPLVQALGGWQTAVVALATWLSRGLIVALLDLSAAMLATPFGWVVLAIGAIGIAAYKLWENWDTVWAAIGGTVAHAVEIIKAAWETVKAAIMDAFQFVLQYSPFGLMLQGAMKVAEVVQRFVPSLRNLFGGEQAAPAAGQQSAVAVGRQAAGAAAGARGTGAVTVDFRNVPQGVQVGSPKAEGMQLDVLMGKAMPGVAGG